MGFLKFPVSLYNVIDNQTYSIFQGFVVMETRNTLQLLTDKNLIKIIPKSGTSFSFSLDNHLFTVGGSNFCIKPSERAVKKWKNKPPYDL